MIIDNSSPTINAPTPEIPAELPGGAKLCKRCRKAPARPGRGRGRPPEYCDPCDGERVREAKRLTANKKYRRKAALREVMRQT